MTFADDGRPDRRSPRPARPSGCGPIPVVEFPPVGKTGEPTTQPAETALGRRPAPGGAGRLARRRPAAADRGAGDRRVDGSHAAGGHRLVPPGACATCAGTNGIPGEEDILVPARALAELQRLPTGTIAATGPRPTGSAWPPAATRSPSGRARSRSAPGCSRGATRTTSQLIPDHYPNRLHLGKESFLAALRRVRLLVRDNTTPVRLSMRPGGVDLSVRVPGRG